MSTYFPKQGEIVRKWFVVDASGQTLGRLASQVARILVWVFAMRDARAPQGARA